MGGTDDVSDELVRLECASADHAFVDGLAARSQDLDDVLEADQRSLLESGQRVQDEWLTWRGVDLWLRFCGNDKLGHFFFSIQACFASSYMAKHIFL